MNKKGERVIFYPDGKFYYYFPNHEDNFKNQFLLQGWGGYSFSSLEDDCPYLNLTSHHVGLFRIRFSKSNEYIYIHYIRHPQTMILKRLVNVRVKH